MDFFQHQDDARRRTGRLVLMFIAAVAAIIVTVYLLIVGLMIAGGSKYGPPTTLQDWWQPQILLLTAAGVGTVIFAGSMYRTATLATGGKSVADLLGGRLLASATHDIRERRLLNVVEEMALASGVPVPPVYILESEADINAFAAGFSPTDAVIGITRGAVNSLTRDELQGVIAHEFSHILNGDMRLNIRLIGVLHGILLLSMIGYVIMRVLMSSRSGRSSSSDRKDGGGGIIVAIFLVGVGLYVIGYIGVFFGHLIKSAISRQREFLADASAVQFTRMPEGIANALKKLGAIGSRIRSPQAEQASHMYFGNGLKASFLQMLSTHPPLVDRIRKIEPNFDGDFSKEHLTWPTADDEKRAASKPKATARPITELIFPGMPHVGTAGFAGAAASSPAAAATASLSAGDMLQDVGRPRQRHLDFAAALLERLPEELQEGIHKPPGAAALIYALLLEADPTDDEPGLRMLTKSLGPEVSQTVRDLIPTVTAFGPAARLPLAQLAMSALRQLSPNEFEEFRQTVIALIRADRKVSIFEYCLQRIIFKNLVAFLKPRPPVRLRYTEMSSVAGPTQVLLSALARFGGDEPAAASAFAAGATAAGLQLSLLPRDACGYTEIDGALAELAASSGEVKRQVLAACAATIGHDGRLTIEEGELLRTIADALDCPVPPPAAALLETSP